MTLGFLAYMRSIIVKRIENVVCHHHHTNRKKRKNRKWIKTESNKNLKCIRMTMNPQLILVLSVHEFRLIFIRYWCSHETKINKTLLLFGRACFIFRKRTNTMHKLFYGVFVRTGEKCYTLLLLYTHYTTQTYLYRA